MNIINSTIAKITDRVLKVLRVIRAPITRTVKPASSWPLWRNKNRPLEPISVKYGYDRGTPIDRIYIEDFIAKHRDAIRGACLEVHDTAYIKKYGAKVIRADALDINDSNGLANIFGDIRNLKGLIADNTYDCLVINHTLNLLDDINAGISECYRILKPGGALLATLPGPIAPVNDSKFSYWRLTKNAAKYLMAKHFDADKVLVETYGNVVAGQAFLTGLAAEELSKEEIAHNDPRFPIAITIKAIK